MKKSASRAALLYCWTLRYVVKRRIIFFSLRFDGLGYRVRVGLASGDKDLCTIFFLHTTTYLSVRGEHVYTQQLNPTSLCCALLYPLSRPPAYCMVRREAWRLYLRTVFSPFPFPLSRTDRGSRGKRRFFVPCRYQKKKESDRHGATFANDVLFFSFSAHAALQSTRGRLETCLCEGREERKGEGGCLMDHGGLSGC